jgi:hypothetical protein
MHPHLRKMAAMLHRARPSFMHAQFVRSMENMQGGREGEKRDGSDRAAVLFYFGSESRGHYHEPTTRFDERALGRSWAWLS